MSTFNDYGQRMPEMTTIIEKLLRGANLMCQGLHAVINIRGPQSRDFLQRMTTNDINKLTPKQPVKTCFTNNKGGIVDYCLIFEREKDDFLVVSSHKDGEILLSWLERYHFVEDLTLVDVSESLNPNVIISSKMVLPDPKAFRYWQSSVNDLSLNFFLIFSKPTKAVPIDEAQFETFRIAAVLPRSPQEIKENFMPQNVNLEDSIAENKGCYIGQEVLAKAQTYQKRVKTLCGVQLSKDEYHKLRVGLRVSNKANMVGKVTSIAPFYVPNFVQALLIADAAPALTLDDSIMILSENMTFKRD